MKWWIQTLKYISVCIVLVGSILFINLKILHISFVPSESMEPTIKTNSLVVGTRYDSKNVKHEDIITFWYKNTILIKRVIGMPGDIISIKKGNVYVNGKQLQSSYTKEPMITEDVTIQIPKNELFVMGDNRNHSADSRLIGTIHKKDVIAHSRFILLPILRNLDD